MSADAAPDTLADVKAKAKARQDALTAFDQATTELRDAVREAYVPGMDLSGLARAAGVSRPTIYAWLNE